MTNTEALRHRVNNCLLRHGKDLCASASLCSSKTIEL